MSDSWIPGAAVALVTSVASGVLSLWRATIRMDGKQSVMETKLSALKEDFARAEHGTKDLRDETARELRDATKSLGDVITQMKVMATEYSAAMMMVTRTLEGVTKKLEYLEMQNAEHDKQIALLKQAEESK